jgi:hypothetical protein
METLYYYFFKVILSSGILFLYYRLFLKDKTFHHYNRFYLLGITVVSLSLPFLQLNYFTINVNSDIYLIMNTLNKNQTTETPQNDLFYSQILAPIFGTVSLFFIGKLILGLLKIQIMKNKYSAENIKGINFYQTDLEEAPFSFFKNLFWKNSILMESDLGRQILKHEMVHIEQKHSWDKVFLEITTSLLWFNPFYYLIKKELNLIHEYLADKKALKNSNTKAFAQMLLANHFSRKHFTATSPFLSSHLKKRLTMLKKSKTKFSYARRILALPLLFAITFIYMVNAKNKEIKSENLERSNFVSKIEFDTISSNQNAEKIAHKDIAFGTDGTTLFEEHPELFSEKDSPTTFNGTNSPEPQKKFADAERKITEAEILYNSPKFKKRINDAEKRVAKAEKLIKSPEFKQRIMEADKRVAEAERLVNSPYFKKRIAEAEKLVLQGEINIAPPLFKVKYKEMRNSASGTNSIANLQPIEFAESFSHDALHPTKNLTVDVL